MKVAIAWVKETLLQRQVPRAETEADHGYLVLPVQRNTIDDGYVFVVRLSLGESRRRDPSTGVAKIRAFERWMEWAVKGGSPQTSILMAHNLFPTRLDALIPFRGWATLDDESKPMLETLKGLVAGLIWDDKVAHAELKSPSSDVLVPPRVREVNPGDIVYVDGAPAVVVSHRPLQRRHHFGTFVLVPLMTALPDLGYRRVSFGSLTAAPEFLKACQVVDQVQEMTWKNEHLPDEDLATLQDQVKKLLSWVEGAPHVGTSPQEHESKHSCLFSNRPRLWHPGRPDRRVLRRSGPVKSEPMLRSPLWSFGGTRVEGPEGSLLIELFDRQGEIIVRLTAEDGRLQMIDMLSVWSDDRSINIAEGPLVPEDWIIERSLGLRTELDGKVIEVKAFAHRVVATYTFQIEIAD